MGYCGKSNEIEKLCAEHNMSVWQLCRLIGVSHYMLAKYEEDPFNVNYKDRERIDAAVLTLRNGDMGQRPVTYKRGMKDNANDWNETFMENVRKREEKSEELIVSMLLDIIMGYPHEDMSELNCDDDLQKIFKACREA